MAGTPHHYSLQLRSVVKQGYSPSVQTPDPVETCNLWLTGDLRICSSALGTPYPSQLRCPLLIFLPSFPIRKFTHTHTNIIFLPFDVYFNRSHQFPMLLWESVFSGLAIYKKADLWRHNSKCLTFYSVTGCSPFTSQGPLILGWLSLTSLLILPPSLILPHILVLFSALIQFLIAEEQKKNCLVFLFSSPSSTEWHMIGLSFSGFLLEVFQPSWSYSEPWKTREGY